MKSTKTNQAKSISTNNGKLRFDSFHIINELFPNLMTDYQNIGTNSLQNYLSKFSIEHAIKINDIKLAKKILNDLQRVAIIHESLNELEFYRIMDLTKSNLNEITKTPEEAMIDLNEIFDIVPNKKIGFFEISWSTSDFVNGDYISQQNFIEKLFNFYGQNESEIEFLTWYRYIDQEIDTCVIKDQKIGDQIITVGGGSSMGTSEYVIERLNQYNCNSGIVTIDQNYKSGWNEFKTQIQMLN